MKSYNYTMADSGQELKPYHLSDVQIAGDELELGAYSSTVEITIPVRGVARRIRDDIILHKNPKIASDFAAELHATSAIRHPNILQFLGVCSLQGSRLPAVVTERMLTNLHDLLTTEVAAGSPTLFPRFDISLKWSILRDVASGLAHLHEHSPPIAHGALSAQNVLLGRDLTAKIGDFRVARLLSPLERDASVYLPPEVTTPVSDANAESRSLETSVDVFSFGVITVFTLGASELLAPAYTEDASVLIVRNQLQRRSTYMKNVSISLGICDMSYGENPFIQVIKQCLENDSTERPVARDLIRLLDLAKSSSSFDESELQQKKFAFASNIIKNRNEPNHQNLDHLIQDLVVENTKLQQELETASERERTSDLTVSGSDNMIRKQTLAVKCLNQMSAPSKMVRGSATFDELSAFFMPFGFTTVYTYYWNTKKWAKLSPCPYSDSAIIIMGNSLIALGGNDIFQTAGGKLYTIQKYEWVEENAEIPEARSDAAVIATPNYEYIIAIGGLNNDGNTTRVELLNLASKKWHRLTRLPHPLALPSATLCGDTLHVIGCGGVGYSCSLTHLPANPHAETTILPDVIAWTPLPRLPLRASTAATLRGELVLVGGMTDDGESVASIHQLVGGEWVKIGAMATERRMCLVASASPDKLFIVGGWRGLGALDSIEECVCI